MRRDLEAAADALRVALPAECVVHDRTQSRVPASLQSRCHQSILGLNRIELTPCARGLIFRLLKLEFDCSLQFVLFAGCVGGALERSLDRARS
jgi:hypothetical protein